MANPATADALFDAADTNRDGRLDKSEFRNLLANGEVVTSSPYEPSSARVDTINRNNQYERYRYREPTTLTTDLTTEIAYKSSSTEATNRYIRSLGSSVYVDSHPQVIQRSTTERPITYEQRVFLRCLEPPPLPVERTTITEVRPEQPPLPPPVVIREHGSCATQPPPLILRERPPTPPTIVPGKRLTRMLPPIPLPPRSLIIERFPDCPEKPRDIIIERWLPYQTMESAGPPQIIPAPPAIEYPAPTHTVILYDAAESRVVRKLEKLGVTREDPQAYIARYGATLLDRETLLHQARNAGVVEDISCALLTPSTGVVTQGYPSTSRYIYGGPEYIPTTEYISPDIRRHSSSSAHGYGHSVVPGIGGEPRSRYVTDDADVVATTAKYNDGAS